MATNLSEFVNIIRPMVPMCPAALIRQELISTLQDFCRRTNIITRIFDYDLETTDVDATLNDSAEVDLSTLFPSLRPISILKFYQDKGERVPELLEAANDLDDLDEDTAKINYYFSDEQKILFYPFNISADAILNIEAAFMPVESITTVEDFFWYDWRDVLKDGTLYRLMDMEKQPWADHGAATKRRRFYLNGVGRGYSHQRNKSRGRNMRIRLSVDW